MLVRHPVEAQQAVEYTRGQDRSGLVLHVETADTWMVFKATGLDEI